MQPCSEAGVSWLATTVDPRVKSSPRDYNYPGSPTFSCSGTFWASLGQCLTSPQHIRSSHKWQPCREA
eukprot:scaffold317470_cov43-Prasinocladus_malaysianus.AAC.1